MARYLNGSRPSGLKFFYCCAFPWSLAVACASSTSAIRVRFLSVVYLSRNVLPKRELDYPCTL